MTRRNKLIVPLVAILGPIAAIIPLALSTRCNRKIEDNEPTDLCFKDVNREGDGSEVGYKSTLPDNMIHIQTSTQWYQLIGLKHSR